MIIKSFGQFWRADEVDWFPGKGKRRAFRLLGRQGMNRGNLSVCDFRYQQGIYILYGNYGPYYTGLTTKQGLGKRLKDHLSDHHRGQWDRFSWFGFRQVLSRTDEYGMRELKDLAGVSLGTPTGMIRDTEALLIRAMGLTNIDQTKFAAAEEWFQIKKLEVDHYLERLDA